MFDILSNLTKAAVGIVTSPIAMVADVVTLGGVLTDRKTTYTGEQAERVMESIEKATS